MNFHRPCGIPELRTLSRGKIKRIYRQWETPWDILRGLAGWETTLRTETNVATLPRQASAQSYTGAAMAMRQAKTRSLPPTAAVFRMKRAAAHAAGSFQRWAKGRGSSAAQFL